MPRSSAQASETGEDTKSSQIPSKDDLTRDAMSRAFLMASVIFVFSVYGYHTNYLTVSMFLVCIGFGVSSFKI